MVKINDSNNEDDNSTRHNLEEVEHSEQQQHSILDYLTKHQYHTLTNGEKTLSEILEENPQLIHHYLLSVFEGVTMLIMHGNLPSAERSVLFMFCESLFGSAFEAQTLFVDRSEEVVTGNADPQWEPDVLDAKFVSFDTDESDPSTKLKRVSAFLEKLAQKTDESSQ